MSAARHDLKVLKDYADFKCTGNSGTYALAASPLGGRGLFSQKPLLPNTEIFREPPLLLGPRVDPRRPFVCVGCHSRNISPKLCTEGCKLPVCSIACYEAHPECSLMRNLLSCGDLTITEQMSVVAPLRAVFLSDSERKVLNSLEGHDRANYTSLLQRLEATLLPNDLEIVRICFQVLDATAFETPTRDGGSARGIFPIAAIMNHDCCPNTRHCFDNTGRMVVETTRAVAPGEELTTSYTCLTWGNQARRAHLKGTKQFVCRCRRCCDPTEFGSQLQALYCMKKRCGGVILPCDSEQQSWSCQDCKTVVSPMRIQIIQKMVGETMLKLGNDPKKDCKILLPASLVPNCNQMAVELKLGLIQLYGNEKGYHWSGLSNAELFLKQILCVQILRLFTILGLGQSIQRGYVLLELAKTMNEVSSRKTVDGTAFHLFVDCPTYGSVADVYQEAKAILQNDILAQATLQELLF